MTHSASILKVRYKASQSTVIELCYLSFLIALEKSIFQLDSGVFGSMQLLLRKYNIS